MIGFFSLIRKWIKLTKTLFYALFQILMANLKCATGKLSLIIEWILFYISLICVTMKNVEYFFIIFFPKSCRIKFKMEWMSQSKIICIPDEFVRKSNKKIILRKTMLIDSRFGFNLVVFVFEFLHHIIDMLARRCWAIFHQKKSSVYVYIHALCKMKSPLRIGLLIFIHNL